MNERIYLIVDTTNKADYNHLTVQNSNDTKDTTKQSQSQINRFLITKQNTIKLPEVNVKTIEDDNIVNECIYYYKNYKISSNYIKYVEKSHEELDKDVEYDMDEEDVCWLKIVNEKRKQESLNEVTVDQFEMLIDRLEKESYFQSSPSSSPSKNEKKITKNGKKQSKKDKKHKTDNGTSGGDGDGEEDDDVICCICLDGECVNSNAILFCDMCNLAVHQECYGVPYIPEGQWLCRRCIQSPSAPVSCCLCPNSEYGAFKQTDNGKWAHMVCAIWIPEVHFANTVFLEPICGIEQIDKARWKLLCYICKKRGQGACIQCDRGNCYTAFHVTCGQQAGLYMNIVQQKHDTSICSDDQSLSSSMASNAHSIGEVRKVAYCHLHTPIDDKLYFDRESEEETTELDDEQLNETNKRKTLNGRGSKTTSKEALMKRAQRLRMKRARKIMSIMRKSNQSQLIMMPHVDQSSIDKILSRVHFSKKQKFFQLLMNYWLLKRQSRNGVPLIRRLQNAPGIKKQAAEKQLKTDATTTTHTTATTTTTTTESTTVSSTTPTIIEEDTTAAAATSSATATTSINCNTTTNNSNALAPISTNSNAASLNNSKSNRLNELRNQLFYWKKLRQDLEKARLLMELIRKRERLKREHVKIHEIVVKYQLKPFQIFLNYLLDQLRDFDKMKIYHQPVSRIDVPNYYEIIKSPMDFHTMSVKINENKYTNFDQFERDFQLIIQNCLHFNEKDSFYYKAAIKLRDQATPMFKRARTMYESVGYDIPTGIHSEMHMNGNLNVLNESNQSGSQQTDVESLLNSEISNDISLEEKLRILLDRLDLANTIKNAGSRSKWASHLKAEINLIKRKISAHINTPTKSTPSKKLDNENGKSTNTPLQQQSIIKYTIKQNINNNTNHNHNHNENDNSNRNW